MNSPLVVRKLIVKSSPIHGYGVFADQAIEADEIIEECHLIHTDELLPALTNYFFAVKDAAAVVLGYGSIYNSSNYPNAGYSYNADRDLMVFRAKRSIKPGEEILVSYGEKWFADRMLRQKESWRNKVKRFVPKLVLLMRFGLVAMALLGVIIVLSRFSAYPF